MNLHRTALQGLLIVTIVAPAGAGPLARGVHAGTTPSCRVVNTATPGKHTSNLQAAIKAADTGATLSVTGTCVGDFRIRKAITIREGAKPATLRAALGRVLHVTGAPVVLKGLRITGGVAPDCEAYDGYVCGGGVYNEGTLRMDGVTVIDNSAPGSDLGGSSYGGGIYNAAGASLRITRSSVSTNTATSAPLNESDAAAIANDGTLVIERSRISGNEATGPFANAGAIYNFDTDARLTVVDSTFSGNEANGTDGARAGAIQNDNGRLTIRRSLFVNNRAIGPGSEGGAIWNDAITAEIGASTFSGNQAEVGGAIWTDAALTLLGSTVTKNTADAAGGLRATGAIVIGSTIIAGNAAGTSPDCDADDGTAALGFNLIGKGDGCSAFADGVKDDQVGSIASPLAAKLGSLSSNGGPTRTHALQAGSPAIDAAGNAPCDTPKDQRGVRRPKGDACDVGGFEKG